jgi:hypothetical protein
VPLSVVRRMYFSTKIHNQPNVYGKIFNKSQLALHDILLQIYMFSKQK